MKIVHLSAIAAAILLAGSANAQAPAAQSPTAPAAPTAPATPKFGAASTLGELMADPAAKAVLVKHIPDAVVDPRMDQALGMTLAEVAQYIGGEPVVKAIEADLALIP